MDFQAIVDRLKALSVPGLVDVDLPRPVNKAEKDPGRGGQPFVIVEPARIVDFLRVCRDDERLGFELLIDITASDPSADDENLWVLIELLSVKHKHRLSIKAFLPKAAASLPSKRGSPPSSAPATPYLLTPCPCIRCTWGLPSRQRTTTTRAGTPLRPGGWRPRGSSSTRLLRARAPSVSSTACTRITRAARATGRRT